MEKKINCAIIFGGRSAEHEISMLSANSVLHALDTERFLPTLIYIEPEGSWHLWEGTTIANNLAECQVRPGQHCGHPIALLYKGKNQSNLFDLEEKKFLPEIDVAFPVLHGPFGEDGTVQGMLKLLGIPFVGAGILGSAVGMDKDATKRLLLQAGIQVARFKTIHASEKTPSFQSITDNLGMPLFVKPANLGSSVGVHQVTSADDYQSAINDAFLYDNKLIIEEKIIGREIECSVLGNDQPIASVPGEIIAHHDFYSYEAKYVDEKGASLIIPAQISQKLQLKIQTTAIAAYQALYCEGMARADFFLTENNTLYVNELNTIPGFTSISMYSKLWAETGIPYSDLVNRLLKLAIDRFESESKLKTTWAN